jgi:hypothetical protein
MSSPALRKLYYRAIRISRGNRGEADEVEILARLARSENAPTTFVEFGFHPIRFNCAALAFDPAWRGLLVDGDADQVSDARALLPEKIDIEHQFLTLDTLDFIRTKFDKLGILSIDVDGNDYWFLRDLLPIGPSVVSVEYNSSFGLAPVTVPYDREFDRLKKHPSGWYHGASLMALHKLCEAQGYGLAAVSDAGANAFFTRSGTLDPATAWRPNAFRAKFSGVPHERQWDEIKHLPLLNV